MHTYCIMVHILYVKDIRWLWNLTFAFFHRHPLPMSRRGPSGCSPGCFWGPSGRSLATHLPLTCHSLATHLPLTCYSLATHLLLTCYSLTQDPEIDGFLGDLFSDIVFYGFRGCPGRRNHGFRMAGVAKITLLLACYFH